MSYSLIFVGYNEEHFEWSKYLKRVDGVAAPPSIFTSAQRE